MTITQPQLVLATRRCCSATSGGGDAAIERLVSQALGEK